MKGFNNEIDTLFMSDEEIAALKARSKTTIKHVLKDVIMVVVAIFLYWLGDWGSAWLAENNLPSIVCTGVKALCFCASFFTLLREA